MDKLKQLQVSQFERQIEQLEREYCNKRSAGEKRMQKAKDELDSELARLNVRIQGLKNKIREMKS